MADMSTRGRGTSSYRGRGGRGKPPDMIARLGKQKLIALEQQKDYQEYLEYKKQKEGNNPSSSSEASYAKILSQEESDNITEYNENPHTEIIFLINDNDLKWKENPWILMDRYMGNTPFPVQSYKTRTYYELILEQGGTCEFHHFSSGIKADIYNFSKMVIKRIISIEDWGISPLSEKDVIHPTNKIVLKYNYWDYKEAHYKVLLYENDKKKHSWFLKICQKVYNHDIPNWFYDWWNIFGTTNKILPEKIKNDYKKWVVISPFLEQKQEKNLFIRDTEDLIFFMEFSIPWILRWIPEFGYTEQGVPCVKRICYTKFWHKMMTIDKETNLPRGQDTLVLIEEKLSQYTEENKKKKSQIRSKLMGGIKPKTRKELIAAYVESLKSDLEDFGECSNEEEKSDASMGIDIQDAQDPDEEIDIEEWIKSFENPKGSSSSKASNS